MDWKKDIILKFTANKVSFITLVVTLFVSINVRSQKQTPEQYITKWKDIAIKEMNDHQVPASITLAQGLLESGSGNSNLAKLANNHFGIKCHSSWKGKTYYQDDDEKDECFRKYKSASESFKDHSLFLKKKRYEKLFLLDITDYKGWAKGLKKAGYATNPKYPTLLISLIERYDLTQYDTPDVIVKQNPVPNDSSISDKVNIGENPIVDVIDYTNNHKVTKTSNKVPFIVIKKGDTYEKLEKELGIRKWQVTKYNDLSKTHELNPGERIFIKPKRCKSQEEFHFVRAGETMRDISQLYGVKLKKLYKRNRLDEGSVPKEGQKIYLRKKKKLI